MKHDRAFRIGAGLVLCAALSAGPAVVAADRPARGLVDGSPFSEFADLGVEVVEIHVPSALLAAISRGMQDDPDAASVISRLDAVEAVIVGFGENPDPKVVERARDLVQRTEKRLAREGWERVVRIREAGDMMNVFVLGDGEMVDGLVVVGFESGEGENEMIFANIAGRIDLAQIGALGESFDIPGLEGIEDSGRGKKE